MPVVWQVCKEFICTSFKITFIAPFASFEQGFLPVELMVIPAWHCLLFQQKYRRSVRSKYIMTSYRGLQYYLVVIESPILLGKSMVSVGFTEKTSFWPRLLVGYITANGWLATASHMLTYSMEKGLSISEHFGLENFTSVFQK